MSEAGGGAARRIALLAGEASGDLLGGAIAEQLRQRGGALDLVGVVGPRMRQAGVRPIGDIEELSVMGLAEVLGEIPRLLRLRRRLLDALRELRPNVVLSIDAPDFHLGLQRRLQGTGCRRVHLVSPTVWAWRPGRTRTVAASVDRLLCLYPFEPECYAGLDLAVDWIGHPLADELEPGDAAAARAALGLPVQGPVLAMLPGSRRGEVARLMPEYARAADWLLARMPDLRIVVPVARRDLREPVAAAVASTARPDAFTLLEGQARAAMTASDCALVASGTATLECMLLGRAMVVAYRVAPLTEVLLRRVGLLKVRSVSLPNLVAGEPLVPELLQEQATGPTLGAHLYRLLTRDDLRREQTRRFAELGRRLRRGAAGCAADLVLAEGLR